MEKIVLFFQNINLTDIWNLIVNPSDQGVLLYVKIIFIVITLILLGITIPLILVSSWIKYRYAKDMTEFLTFRPYGAKKTLKEWNKIVKKLESNKDAEYKLAVIDADAMLEQTLEKNGYIGDTMEERMEKIDSIILSNKQAILDAHKIRNSIVYNPDFELSLEQAKKTIEVFEEALRGLDAF